jgi:hypothetical protein
MAKMLGASLSRTYFLGDFFIFRNTPAPIFLVPRQGVEEIYIETPALSGQELANLAMAWKPKARGYLPPVEQYSTVLFVDADSVCLRNAGHLLSGDGWDIRFQTEPGRSNQDGVFNGFFAADEHRSKGIALSEGVNSGTWAVRSECFYEVMEEWEKIMARRMTAESIWREQSAWNRLILDQLGSATARWRCENLSPTRFSFLSI